MPVFPLKLSLPVTNIKTGIPYTMVRSDRVAPNLDQLKSITEVCNEAPVYDLLSREKLGGLAYPISKAESFLSWAARGWQDGTHFVFLVLNSDSKTIAAVDIKSSDKEFSEIGYWASSKHSGIMRPSIAEICKLGTVAGFQSFMAKVHRENLRSKDVLIHNGFNEWTEESTPTQQVFRKNLYNTLSGNS